MFEEFGERIDVTLLSNCDTMVLTMFAFCFVVVSLVLLFSDKIGQKTTLTLSAVKMSFLINIVTYYNCLLFLGYCNCKCHCLSPSSVVFGDAIHLLLQVYAVEASDIAVQVLFICMLCRWLMFSVAFD